MAVERRVFSRILTITAPLFRSEARWRIVLLLALPVTFVLAVAGLNVVNNVIGGRGAFVMVAKNFDSFGEAIIGKLIAEVAQAQEPRSQEPRWQRAATR